MNILEEFKALMKSKNIDAYLVPTSDYHLSEYTADYFKTRKFLSGFTGSAGTLLVIKDEAYLWTDGRYFIQALKEIEPFGIKLMRMGSSDPTIEEFLTQNLKDNMRLGFDGKTMPTNLLLNIKKNLGDVEFVSNLDLASSLWLDRPLLPASEIYTLSLSETGISSSGKIALLREELKKTGANVLVLSALEDIAWLFNMRGSDILHTPVFLSFAIITQKEVSLFVQKASLSQDAINRLYDNKVSVIEYSKFYSELKNIQDKIVFLDKNKTNFLTYKTLKENNDLVFGDNPTLMLKAVKNKVEIENTKKAHLSDGLVMTRFMYYLKNNLDKNLTELDVADYLEKHRSQVSDYIDLSFGTIAAYKENGAMMHYAPTKEKHATIKQNSFLLVDSGGHYKTGTTDITRTFACGELTESEKINFTTVLKSVIDLSSVVFMKGCSGLNLDILARGPLWKRHLDYKCGTGHGVGHILAVHEGPNGFRYQHVPERNDGAFLVPGMITTIEPGVYLEGQYGIRTENETVVVEDVENEQGHFYKLETLTFVPIDLDAVIPSLLTKEETTWLNDYHKKVFEFHSPNLSGDELLWLKKYTRAI